MDPADSARLPSKHTSGGQRIRESEPFAERPAFEHGPVEQRCPYWLGPAILPIPPATPCGAAFLVISGSSSSAE